MKEKGFTLAEVLITLAIIGVVAALTVPSAVKNYQKTRTVTKLKKAYSVMNQAHRLAEVDNGPYETWDIEMSESSYYQKYINPYFKAKSLRSCGGGNNNYCSYKESGWKMLDGTATQTGICAGATFITTDNIVYAYRAATTDGEGNPVVYTNVFVDINGPKGPNYIGKDVFIFNRNKKGITPLGLGSSISTINQKCHDDGYYCAAKIMADGWEIKDDYPW